jgi:outer membrane receptor protein involved in Fe transport
VGVGSRYADGDVDNDSAKVESYEVVNLSAKYRIKDWSLGLRIDNVLNEKYSTYVQEGSLFLPPTFAPVKTTFQAPAAERNFWVTAKYSF